MCRGLTTPTPETTDELAKLDQAFSGELQEAPKTAGFKLSDDDNHFLEAPAGAALLSTGASGTESRIERAQDTVVRIGIENVAVVTSRGQQPRERSRPATAPRKAETARQRSSNT